MEQKMKIHGNSKLTDSQVREIFKRGLSGERQAHLAREFGVTQTHVHSIVNRRTRIKATEWNVL
jgi:DNA invertase Pin-like site-specific DNA recombinase